MLQMEVVLKQIRFAVQMHTKNVSFPFTHLASKVHRIYMVYEIKIVEEDISQRSLLQDKKCAKIRNDRQEKMSQIYSE